MLSWTFGQFAGFGMMLLLGGLGVAVAAVSIRGGKKDK